MVAAISTKIDAIFGLTRDGFEAPKRIWSRQRTFIRYADIASVSSCTVNRQQLFVIVHARGRFTVAASLFKSRLAFEEFCQEFARRL